MNMIESLLGNQAEGAVQQLAGQFGLDRSQASTALQALLPSLAAGFKRNVSSPSGLESLLGALGSGQHQQYFDNLQTLEQPETTEDGNGILGHIFGSKDVSRAVAQRASAQSGIGTDLLKKMLPVAAAIVMGALAKQRSGGVSAQAGSTAQRGSPSGGGILDILSPMLDSDRDGSVMNDVVGMIGKYLGGR